MIASAPDAPADAPGCRPVASNFRDFGDCDTLAGRRLVTGRLFRSDRLLADDASVAWLVCRGIRTVVDLRTEDERAAETETWFGRGIRVVSTPVVPSNLAHMRAVVAMGDATRDRLRGMMLQMYRGYVDDDARAFGRAIEVVLMAARQAPFAIQSTAGKDRTGFLVAVLQMAMGVSEDVILDDYLVSNELWDRATVPHRLAHRGPASEPILEASPDYLAVALEALKRRDGDAGAFLLRATNGRLSPDEFEALLEPRARFQAPYAQSSHGAFKAVQEGSARDALPR